MTLYVSDLDGTLLNREAALSPATREGLARLLDEGLQFTVASARHVVSIRQIVAGLPLRLPVISSNGAYLSDALTGRHELVNAMDPALAGALHELVARHGFAPFVLTHGPKGDQLFYERIDNEGQRRFVEERQRNGDPRLRHAERIADVLGDPAVTFMVIGAHAPLAALRDAVAELCGDAVEMHLAEDLYMPGWPWLNIHDRRASKAQAIRTLVQRYGLAERELVAFGDHVNDLSMLRAADRAIAVGNAIEAVRASAHHVIGDHTEDSVLRFLEADFKAAPRPAPRR
ncbi:MAG: HAD family phosphatase [Pelomonas sp.]|nr:HAD family phosphatase [Roseateles sp.]